MKVFVINNEGVNMPFIKKQLTEISPIMQLLGTSYSIEEAVDWLGENTQPDLILMNMNVVQEQDMALLREQPVHCPLVIFKNFDKSLANALGIIKPINDQEHLYEKASADTHSYRTPERDAAVSKQQAVSWVPDTERKADLTYGKGQAYRGYFLVRWKEQVLSIPVKQIACFFSEGKTTFLKTTDAQVFSVMEPLEKLELQLDPCNFYRISRKYLIARDAISKIFVHFNGLYKILLKVEVKEDLVVTKGRMARFKVWLGG